MFKSVKVSYELWTRLRDLAYRHNVTMVKVIERGVKKLEDEEREK